MALFKKLPKLRAYFIDESGQMYSAKKKYDNNMFTMKVSGKVYTYIVDKNFLHFDQDEKLPVGFYYVGNPVPVQLRHERSESTGVNSVSLTNIMESKIVQELFSSEENKKAKLVLIIVAINAVLTLVIMLKVMGWVSF
jgi:hypothetical protein